MIYGIVASELETAVGGIGALLPDALASADFINGIYKDGASTVAFGDLIDDSTATPTDLVAGGGLLLLQGFESAQMVGTFRTTFLTFDFTAVVEIEINAATFLECVFLHVGTYFAEIPNNYSNDFWCEFIGEWDMADENNDVGAGGGPGGGSGTPMSRTASDLSNALTNGIHRLAITRTNDRVAISVDGFPAVMDNSQGPFSMNTSTPEFSIIGGWAGPGTPTTGPSPVINSFYMRSLAVYSPQVDEILPLLSNPGAGTPAGVINFLNASTVVTATSTTTITLNLPTNRTVGNMLIAVTTIVTAKSPTWPAGWNAIGAGFAAWRSVDGSEITGPAITWTGASTERGYIFQWIGTATSITNTTDNQSTGTPATTAAITTAQDKSIAVAIIVNNTTSTPSLPTGFYNVLNSSASGIAIRIGHVFVETSGTTTSSVSSTITGGGNAWKAALIELPVA